MVKLCWSVNLKFRWLSWRMERNLFREVFQSQQYGVFQSPDLFLKLTWILNPRYYSFHIKTGELERWWSRDFS
jgi:hypothetical protein